MNPPPDAPQLPPGTSYYGKIKDFPRLYGFAWDADAKDDFWFEVSEDNTLDPNWHLALPVKSSPAVPVKAGEDGCGPHHDGLARMGHTTCWTCNQKLTLPEPPVTDSQRETPRTDDLIERQKNCYPVGQEELDDFVDLARTLERELEFTRAAVGSWKRAFIRVKAREDGETHFWQGDGEDHLESLGCPILISPEQLQGIFDELAAAKQDSERLEWAMENFYIRHPNPNIGEIYLTREEIDDAMREGEGK